MAFLDHEQKTAVEVLAATTGVVALLGHIFGTDSLDKKMSAAFAAASVSLGAVALTDAVIDVTKKGQTPLLANGNGSVKA